MKKLFQTFFLLACSFSVFAQQNFDLVNYSVPSGWEKQIQEKQVTLQKQDYKNNSCKIIIYPSEIASGNGEKDFREQWKKYVKNVYNITNDSLTIEMQKEEDWNIYSTYSITSINGIKAVYAFTCIIGKKKIISINAITTDKVCLSDINTFFSGMELETVADTGRGTKTKTTKKKPARRGIKILALKGLKDMV
ncbi:MAG: hypothetical protein ACYC01_08080 [Lutibacter sp.]